MFPNVSERRLMTIAIAIIVAIVLTMYVGYLSLFYFNQEALLFPATHRAPYLDLELFGDQVVEIVLETPSGPAHLLYLPPPASSEPAPAIIYAHGNGEIAEDWIEPSLLMQSQGVGVLILEYAGYGRYPGIPSVENIYDMSTAGYTWLTAQSEIDSDRILLIGQSIGSGVVTEIARNHPDETLGMVLISPYKSIRSLARDRYLPGFLAKYPLNNLEGIEEYNAPLLIWHGRYDTLIPPEHGEALAELAPNAEFYLHECGHSLCVSSWDEFWEKLSPFFEETGLLPA